MYDSVLYSIETSLSFHIYSGKIFIYKHMLMLVANMNICGREGELLYRSSSGFRVGGE
jgi:hypothetical protein